MSVNVVNMAAEIQSPCIAVCKLTAQNICSGCGRTLDEIGAWRDLSTAEKTRVIELARERRAAMNI